MTDVFISYSRKDKEFVRRLHEGLSKLERDTWVDWEDIPLTADWRNEIYAGIDAADNFAFIISPDSVASKVCGEELTHAIKNNKRLVPIMHRDVKGLSIHEALSAHNWIYFREEDNFDTAFQAFIQSIDTDLDHVRAHTRMTIRAKEWEAKGRNPSFLLRGLDLQDAEKWLRSSVDKSPQPTQLQTEYLLASRQAAGSRQRRIIGAVSVAMVLMTLLALFAAVQYQAAGESLRQANEARATAVAESQRADLAARIALSKQLAAQALTLQDERLDLALLLSLESNRIDAGTGNLARAQSEGSLLSTLETSPQLRTFLRGHEDWIQTVALTPDESMLISADTSGVINLWDMATQQVTRQLVNGEGGDLIDTALSPDGSLFAASSGNAVVMWNLGSGEQIYRVPTGESDIRALDFSPDGALLAVGSADQTIHLLNPTTGEPVGEPLRGHNAAVESLDFAPNGTLLASAGRDAQIILWDTATWQTSGKPLSGHDVDIRAVAFSPDSNKLASGDTDGQIILWNMITRQMITDPLDEHEDRINELTFSPDGRIVASASADQTVRLWLASTGRSIGEPLEGHSNWVNSLVFKQDSRTLISGSDDLNIIFWDTNNRQRIASQVVSQRHDINTLALTSAPLQDSGVQVLAAGHEDGSITLWDAANGQAFGSTLIQHKGEVTSVVMSPDNRLLVSTGMDGKVILWNEFAAYRPRFEILAEMGEGFAFHSAALSSDGALLAATGSINDSTTSPVIYLWNIETREQIGEIQTDHSAAINAITFSPDGRLIASASEDNTARLWSVETQAAFGGALNKHTQAVLTLAFNPDGSQLATGSRDQLIYLWDVATQQSIGQPLAGHTWTVNTLAFSPDGKMIVSGGGDRALRLWDVSTGDSIGGALTAHTNSVNTLIFSPDGKMLYSGGDDNRIMRWDVDFTSWEQSACQIANRNLTELEWQRFVGDAYSSATCPDLDNL
jgi:WD40 repeat protein